MILGRIKLCWSRWKPMQKDLQVSFYFNTACREGVAEETGRLKEVARLGDIGRPPEFRLDEACF